MPILKKNEANEQLMANVLFSKEIPYLYRKLNVVTEVRPRGYLLQGSGLGWEIQQTHAEF